MLDAAGLSFVLEEPAKILEQDVLEFYRNAKISSQGKKIKSCIQSCKIILKASGINSILRMPEVESEDLSADAFLRAKRLCGILDEGSKIRRKFMNDGGKLLCDILGKVLLCKVGYHDYLSEEAFKIHTAIICRKNFNFGEVIFEKVKESFLAPNFGRILSLLLNGSNPDMFNLGRGSPIHHTKKITSSIFCKWERVIPKGGVKNVVGGDEEALQNEDRTLDEGQPTRGSGPSPAPVQGRGDHVEGEFPTPRGEPSPDPDQGRGAHVEGELPTPRENVESGAATTEFPPSEADPVYVDPVSPAVPDVVHDQEGQGHFADKDVAIMLEDSRRSPAEFTYNSEHSEDLPDPESVHSEKSDSVEKGSFDDQLELAKKMSLAEGEKDQEGTFMDESAVPQVLPSVLLLPPPTVPLRKSPKATVLDEQAQSTSFVSPDDFETGESSQSSLLKSISSLLQAQTEHFAQSIKSVYQKIDKVDSALRQEMAEMRHEMGKFKSDQEAWLSTAGKALDHTNTAVGHALNNLHQVAEDVEKLNSAQASLRIAHGQGLNFLDDQVERQLGKLYTLLHEDVIKGEESMVSRIEESSSKLTDLDGNVFSKMQELQENIKQTVIDVQWYTHESTSWLFKEVAGMLGFTVVDKMPNAPSSSVPGPSAAPSSSLIPVENVEFAEADIPASSYQEFWDDPVVESSKVPESSEKSLKRKIFGDKPSAKRSNTLKKIRIFFDKPPPRNFQESWSPTSKGIILSSFNLVSKQNESVSKHYSQDEWDKFKKRTTERAIHFKTGGSKETTPDKYWPKPKAFFERMESEQKKRAEAAERIFEKQKSKDQA